MSSNVSFIIFNFVINLIELVVSVLLAPINLIIAPFVPEPLVVNNAINSFFAFINDCVTFVLGWLHLPNICYEFIVLYISFLIAYIPVKLGFKIVVKLYQAFKV